MSLNPAANDESVLLWNQFRQGDPLAFGEIIRLYYKELFNYGKKFVRDRELLKDLLQELFASLWENRKLINETRFVKYYLLKSLRRHLTREMSKQTKSPVRPGAGFTISFEGRDSEESHALVQEKEEQLAQLSLKLRGIIKKLSSRQQEVIYLRFYVNAGMEEIADIMSLNRQSVYNLLYDSLQKLKGLAPYDLLITSPFILLFLLPYLFL